MSSRIGVLRLTAGVLTLGLSVAVALAQPPRPPLDPLAEADARRKVEDQKAEISVRDAMKLAESQARSNPTKAIQTLKASLRDIDSAAAISGDTRKSLTSMLSSRISQLEGKPALSATGTGSRFDSGYKADPNATAVRRDKQTAYESYAAELKDVNDAIQRIDKLRGTGLNREADRIIADLAKKYPNNVAVIRLQDQDGLASRVADAKDFSTVQEKRITLALNNVSKSSLPAAGDVEFPKKERWDEITKRRSEKAKLTEKERKIIEALDKPMTADWNGKMLEEALQELSNVIDQNLFIDKKSLTDPGDLNKPVTLQAKGLSARTVLRQLLAAQGLTFIVKDEAIQVVSVEKARELLVTRVYYLGDLARGVGPFGGVTAGQFLNFQQTMANVDMLIKSIKSSVDPLCWKENGGPCTISFHYPSMAIIVKASAEVHSSLGSALGGK